MTGMMTTIAVCLILSIPVAAQETTTAADLRAVLEDFRDGTIDKFDVTPKIANGLRKHKSRHEKRLKSFGEIEAITFWETFGGIDLYLVSFEHARVVLALARDDATIRHFRYRSVLVTR